MRDNPFELRFRLGRIPVVVEPWFWLAGVLLGGQLMGPRILLWLLVFFVSVLVHELGHALSARAFGAHARIRLYSFGGLTYPDRKLSRWRDIAMTLAGPGAGFALAAVAFGLAMAIPSADPNLRFVLGQLVTVNVVWGLMNLLPVPPLDGGQVAMSLAGPKHAKAARIAAVAVSGAVVAYALSAGQTYLAVLFGLLCFQNVQALRGGDAPRF